MMIFFDSPTSPYCRKVSMVIHELGLGDRIETRRVGGTAVAPGTMPLDVNPLGKIPCLVRPDGPALYDSRVICGYLNQLGGGFLYSEGVAEWDIKTLEATADGVLDAAILVVYEARIRPEDYVYEPWVEGQLAKVARALDAIEARWTPLLAAPLTMGHIAVGAMLGYLDFRQIGPPWRADHPQLAAWYESFSATDRMMDTIPS